ADGDRLHGAAGTDVELDGVVDAVRPGSVGGDVGVEVGPVVDRGDRLTERDRAVLRAGSVQVVIRGSHGDDGRREPVFQLLQTGGQTTWGPDFPVRASGSQPSKPANHGAPE